MMAEDFRLLLDLYTNINSGIYKTTTPEETLDMKEKSTLCR